MREFEFGLNSETCIKGVQIQGCLHTLADIKQEWWSPENIFAFFGTP
jgi:hypothetical protein